MPSDDLWAASARRLIPVMEASFPKIKEELETIANALFQGLLNPRAILQASLTGGDHEHAELTSRLEVMPQSLAFTLGQIA